MNEMYALAEQLRVLNICFEMPSEIMVWFSLRCTRKISTHGQGCLF